MYRCVAPNFETNPSFFRKLSCFLSEGVPKLIVGAVCVCVCVCANVCRLLVQACVSMHS